MNKYSIPVRNFDDLQKKFNRVINKGANITFNVVGESLKEISKDRFIKCIDVEVGGEYKINGWEFIATIEHTPNGNIIRRCNNDDSIIIPEKYKTSAPYCEHCHTVRYRKDTYLVYNEETKEFKQLGKNCLYDFTNGLNAEDCASLAELVKACDKRKYDANEEDIYDEIYSDEEVYYSATTIKKIIFKTVKENGYNGQSILDNIDKMLNMYKDNNSIINTVSNNELDNITKWANTLNTETNDYYRNAVLAWELDYIEYRHFKLIASLISTYLRYLNDVDKNKDTKYIGNVGDKIIIDVSKFRVLYVKPSMYYNGLPTFVYEIIDTDNNTYIWSTTTVLKDTTISIKATIKEHKEYRGVKQTVITRGKIID